MNKPQRAELPPGIVQRGFNRSEAAAYIGLPLSTFYSLQRLGLYPGPTLPGRRYDRILLDKVMDRASRIDELMT